MSENGRPLSEEDTLSETSSIFIVESDDVDNEIFGGEAIDSSDSDSETWWGGAGISYDDIYGGIAPPDPVDIHEEGLIQTNEKEASEKDEKEDEKENEKEAIEKNEKEASKEDEKENEKEDEKEAIEKNEKEASEKDEKEDEIFGAGQEIMSIIGGADIDSDDDELVEFTLGPFEPNNLPVDVYFDEINGKLVEIKATPSYAKNIAKENTFGGTPAEKSNTENYYNNLQDKIAGLAGEFSL